MKLSLFFNFYGPQNPFATCIITINSIYQTLSFNFCLVINFTIKFELVALSLTSVLLKFSMILNTGKFNCIRSTCMLLKLKKYVLSISVNVWSIHSWCWFFQDLCNVSPLGADWDICMHYQMATKKKLR